MLLSLSLSLSLLLPAGVYEKAGSAGSGLLIWCLCGLVATLCTLAYAELGKDKTSITVWEFYFLLTKFTFYLLSSFWL